MESGKAPNWMRLWGSPCKSKSCWNWRTGFPPSRVDDNPVDVVQGTGANDTPVKFYFDEKSGLLIRLVRYTDTVLGLIPYANRLLGLSRRFRSENAIPFGNDVNERAVNHGPDIHTSERSG